MREIELDGGPVNFDQFSAAAFGSAKIAISAAALERAERSHEHLQSLIESGERVYGVNTGFGPLKSEFIQKDQAEALQWNLIRSHAVGVGDPLPREVVRGAMLLLAASHLRGFSGVTGSAAMLICRLLNEDDLPTVPSQGSLGASGDLAPLSHIAIHLAERGLKMERKTGLSLINGTHVHTAIGALCVLRAEVLMKAFDIACAINLEANLCSRKPFDARIHSVRPHSGQAIVARNIWRMTEGSGLVASHANCGEVQDAYSIRCAPQVHGAARDAVSYLRKTVEIEMGSVTDNPLLFDGEALSAGNFHGEPVGLALDFFKIGMAEIASISERRTERCLNPAYNRGLPPFLAANPGLESGMMLCQYTAAALVSENKVLAHPSCVDSIPTGGNQEDHVSMAMNAGLHAQRVVENARRVAAIELLVASQALEVRMREAGERPGAMVLNAFEAVRRQSKSLQGDRPLGEEIERLDVEPIAASVGDLE